MTLVLAHRGLHAAERENTLAAFGAARAAGADGVELDVRASADGALVVVHDPAVGGVVVAAAPAAALPAWVPTLAEALEACAGLVVNVEVKNSPGDPGYDATGALARAVVAAVAGARARVILSSFDRATCEAARAADAALDVGWLLVPGADVIARVARAAGAGLSALHPHHRDFDASGAAAAAAAGLGVNVWTVNARADVERVGALGVAAVITDDPAGARDALGPRAP